MLFLKQIVISSEAWQSQAMQNRSVSRGLPRFARNDVLFLCFYQKHWMVFKQILRFVRTYSLTIPL